MGKFERPEVERRLEHFKAASKQAGVKLTHQRLEIFREIASSRDHPDAERVLRSVQARMPTVSLDTVYRTLWMLNDLGLVTTLGPRRDSVRFDANLARHHHYVCVRCGLVRDFDSAAHAALPVPAAGKQFGSVVDVHIEVRGICDECAQAPADEPTPRQQRPRSTKKRSVARALGARSARRRSEVNPWRKR